MKFELTSLWYYEKKIVSKLQEKQLVSPQPSVDRLSVKFAQESPKMDVNNEKSKGKKVAKYVIYKVCDLFLG